MQPIIPKAVNVLFICKAHVAGRQCRTLKKHLPKHINFFPYTFDTTYEGQTITRDNWHEIEKGTARILGEYERIVHYGLKGDIVALETPIQGL